MKKKAIYILRQLLVGIVALQLLNLSIDSQAYLDNDCIYDYSYAYNLNYDPTESAVEWIIEMNCGQQSRFSYDDHSDSNKTIIKTFHWQTDLHQHKLALPYRVATRCRKPEEPGQKIPSRALEIISPPPDTLPA
jgi:hypothetical protein